MKKYLLIIALFVLQISFGQESTTTYYFIRHAEKVDNSQNPDLSEIGLERANLWSKIFSEVGFDEIYSTDYKRTTQTASPTATAKKIKIKLYNPKTTAIDSFKKETLGKKVLIVGHSNTTPNFVNQIINQKKYADIEDTTFGNLYIVTIVDKTISFQLLKL
ncbi:phosphoglycerate mutase family protein [Flavobacterium sp. LB2P84]|uniref:Phosphoglycerate mutase family protein n=1 Tax=Flavobacterium yafengii TaxID=3041253 RepID=A0AAW6TSU3_9FLAO|nr:phosphoglycerate mutase family protein [Flavobacterium yafengii]MDI5950450.1 phosphoglycerate mutase family protein [Flavobacterium yafengii]MDI6033647.1 phosphoglycerate mutase family protein [Flavobacterium yafengii]